VCIGESNCCKDDHIAEAYTEALHFNEACIHVFSLGDMHFPNALTLMLQAKQKLVGANKFEKVQIIKVFKAVHILNVNNIIRTIITITAMYSYCSINASTS